MVRHHPRAACHAERVEQLFTAAEGLGTFRSFEAWSFHNCIYGWLWSDYETGERKPTADELEALQFAWKVCKHVKSNAIVYALKDGTVGIGAGQMSRVDSSRIAAWKAEAAARQAGDKESWAKGSVVASSIGAYADEPFSGAQPGADCTLPSFQTACVIENSD